MKTLFLKTHILLTTWKKIIVNYVYYTSSIIASLMVSKTLSISRSRRWWSESSAIKSSTVMSFMLGNIIPALSEKHKICFNNCTIIYILEQKWNESIFKISKQKYYLVSIPWEQSVSSSS